MKNSLAKLWGAVLDLGYHLSHSTPRQTAEWLAKSVRLLFYNRIEYIVFTRSLEEPLPEFKSDLPLRFQIADLASFSSVRKAILPAEFRRLKKRLLKGRICLLAYWKDEIAYYGWISDKIDFETDNMELKLSPGDAYLDDAYTLPAFRDMGIGSGGALQRLRYIKEKGYKRSVLIVNSKNLPPQRISKKYGYQEADRLILHRILMKRTWRSQSGKY